VIVRDQAARARDSCAEDRDRVAELRDREAEEREALSAHDLDVVSDRHRLASDQPFPLHQAGSAPDEPTCDDGPPDGETARALSGGASTHARERLARDTFGHTRSLGDLLQMAQQDRLGAARDRERAAGDREDAAGDRREGARQRATALQDREESRVTDQRAIQTLESMSDAFFTLDSDWRFTYLNPQTEAILERHRQDLIGKSVWDEFPEGVDSRFDEEFRRALREQTPVRFEARYEPLGRLLQVRLFPSADGLAVYFSDVTRERLQEERLRQAQRLEAIGQATAGVAHDFGNILAAVRGFAHLGLAATRNEKAAHCFTEIDRAGVKASELTHQLLAFARQQKLAPGVVQLNDVVENLSSMLAQLVTPGIELRFALSPEPVAVFVDRSQLEQVLLNLVMNSSDAIDASGTITVATSNRNPKHVAHERGPLSGWLQVKDDGSGIPAEALPRIFDPFFSTKQPESATGLGLATIYGIVSQSGGSITVESTVGAGTTMTVELPAAAAHPTQQPTTTAGQSSS
jgi:PAS domain S-box-containing protein